MTADPAAAGRPDCLSRSSVAAFEKGHHSIKVISLRQVAAALGLTFSALVDDPANQCSLLLVPTA